MGQKIENLSDLELFRILKNQDKNSEQAFTEIYNRYSPFVFAYCRRFLFNTQAAEDVFQEVFIKFHQNTSKVDEMTNVKGYLLTIARNLCRNYQRDSHTSVPFEDYNNIIIESRQEDDELLDLIKRAIELIPDDLRELFILREYDGMSYTQIAEITKTNINTVKVKLFRARQKLKKILEPYIQDISNI
ncbi:RNA polymerase sigma factor [Bacteroidetes/Chlorobi group bacterium ChocPot_Mid]|jgi:RNA polymerase sigma-70 factor (ECF subfamily)|nr:MAG: RNA polymerase sigma factor [Bacteroidetes/Chlorobi group bacterium ChocPot_Mid]